MIQISNILSRSERLTTETTSWQIGGKTADKVKSSINKSRKSVKRDFFLQCIHAFVRRK